jgi:hypothetical protein
MQIKNKEGELVAMIAKTTAALIMSAALGAGSEMTIDIASVADWTAILAICVGLQQVCNRGHFCREDWTKEFLSSDWTR